MNKEEANKEAKKIYDKWTKDREEIEKKAKEDGTWQKAGLDGNSRLFKELDEKVKLKLEVLRTMIDDD